MKITCDPSKRADTLGERGLDFYDAATVFAGKTLTLEDDRFDYGETRYQTYGVLDERAVMIVWTPRVDARHIRALLDLIESDRRSKLLFVKHHLVDPRFTPVG